MRRPKKAAAPLNDLSLDILAILRAEFTQNNRTTQELLNSYVGMSLAELQSRFLDSGATSRVDYDLALKALEDRKLVGTGPMEMNGSKNPFWSLVRVGIERGGALDAGDRCWRAVWEPWVGVRRPPSRPAAPERPAV